MWNQGWIRRIKMKRFPMSIIFGIVAILITIIMYFVILENIFARIICLITLIGVVLSEIVVTVLAYFSKGEPRKIGAVVAAAFLIPISIALSVLYIVNFPEGYGSYVGCYFSILAITLVIVAIIWKFADGKVDENARLQNAKANMLELRKLVKCIMLKPSAEKFKKELVEIEEKLHFTNDAVIDELDANIHQMLIELDNNIDNENFELDELIQKISSQIDRRTILTKTIV
jgi:hypothetical protein